MVRKLTACALAVSSFMLAGQVLAAGTFTMKIGAEFRSEYEYHNNGLAEPNEDATSTINLNALKVKLYGNVGDNTTFNFLIDATTSTAAGLVEYAYLTHSINDMFAIRIGKNYLNYGGFERKRQDYKAIYLSPAVTGGLGPMANYHVLSAPAIEGHLSFGDAGKVVVQVATDAPYGRSSHTPVGANDNTDLKQPSVYVEYTGNFSGVKVLGQYGISDYGNATNYGVGLGVDMQGVSATLDWNQEIVSTSSKDDQTAMNTVLHVSYNAGAFTPWFTFNMWEMDQEPTDAEDNTPGLFDDNLMGWAVGVTCSDSSKAFHPYAAFGMNQGDFASGVKGESEMFVKVGVTSEF